LHLTLTFWNKSNFISLSSFPLHLLWNLRWIKKIEECSLQRGAFHHYNNCWRDCKFTWKFSMLSCKLHYFFFRLLRKVLKKVKSENSSKKLYLEKKSLKMKNDKKHFKNIFFDFWLFSFLNSASEKRKLFKSLWTNSWEKSYL
jgi:hypothetical protein